MKSENQCNIKEYKDNIRSVMKKKRAVLSKAEIEEKSFKICQKLFMMDCFFQAKNVSVYMDSFNEVKTQSILEKCKELNKSIFVPIIRDKKIYLSQIGSCWINGEYNIREPQWVKLFDPKEIDIFIVPGLAFSNAGGRIGFGKGYYDRLMEGCAGIKIGLSYDFQLINYIPIDEYDKKMDYVLTN